MTRERDEEIRTGLAKLLNKEQDPPLRRSIVDSINSKQGIQKAFSISGMVWRWTFTAEGADEIKEVRRVSKKLQLAIKYRESSVLDPPQSLQ